MKNLIIGFLIYRISSGLPAKETTPDTLPMKVGHGLWL